MDVKPGDRIVLLKMGADDPDPIPPGSTGTVESVTSGPLGQVGVRWDGGRSLFLLMGIDLFSVITDEPATQPSRPSSVKIPSAVLNGIEAVRASGLTNMFDRPAVQLIARELGFEDAAEWLADPANKQTYSQGVFKGFEPDGQ